MKIPSLTLILFFSVSDIFGQDATVIYKNNVNSTVTIQTDKSLGSGFFISDSIIATNFHVIKGATKVFCYSNNSSIKYEIEDYLAIDKSIDLILLKVSILRKIPIKIATTSILPGQKVYVIGSPVGLQATMSDGIVSGIREFKGQYLIQITAPISPGSSGGPVLNTKGEVIGVSVGQMQDGQNLNFAIPINYLKKLTMQPLIVKPISSLGIIKIGNQIWMNENLNVSNFRNGDPILEAETNEEWIRAAKEGSPAWCYYENNSVNGEKFGKLYNWYAVNDPRGLAPNGWHIPNINDWIKLIDYFGGGKTAAPEFRDKTGFAAIPNGGLRYNFNDLFYMNFMWGEADEFWSSTIMEGNNISTMHLLYNVNAGTFFASKQDGLYVRCLRD